MKKTILSLSLALASFTSVASADIAQSNNAWFTDGQQRIAEELAKQHNTNRAKNIILLISDGNGVGTNYATRLFMGQQAGGFGDEYVLPHEAFPHLALLKTYNVNAQTPDSAGTGTAMNTGVKTKAGVIGLSENTVRGDCSTVAGNELTSIADLAHAAGKSVGTVSTARITHATPASNFAVSADRGWEASVPEGCTAQKDIASQLVDAMQRGRVDVAFGGGLSYFLPADTTVANVNGRREDGQNLVATATAANAAFASNSDEFQQLPTDGRPLLALFGSSHMQYEADRHGEPSLAEMTEMAIKALSSNENGFFLQIEAGRVDHANHAGNLARVVRDGAAFAEAIQKAVEMSNLEDTLIIVTADHEHAISFNGYCGRGSDILGLCMGIDGQGVGHNGEALLASDGKPYTVAGYLNGPGAVLTRQIDGNYFGARPVVTEEEATDIDYIQQALVPMRSETHVGTDVAAYALGPWAHLFDGTMEQNIVFHVMHHAMNAK